MINISDRDIEYAELKLLPTGCSFDEERRTFIRKLDSCDVIACPGSGKTTALLAKLLILSRKMPFVGGGGICVLTHTNVAINEIKEKLGSEADTIIAYPNFFGTIQSFVNRFLAIPCFREIYGFKPHTIDNETHMGRLIAKCRGNDTIKKWIWAQEKNTPNFTAESAFGSIKISPGDLSFNLSALFKKDTSPSYKAIHRTYKSIFEEGLIRYDHAYSLALHYLFKHPKLKGPFLKRFRYVLIDEMQDTNTEQLEVFGKIFSDDEAIIQRVGDPNQAIFNSSHGGEMKWSPARGALTFSNSMRFGDTIAKALAPVSVNRSMKLAGNPVIESLKPHIITYDDSNLEDAIAAFGILIQKLNLDSNPLISNKIFKAIGWVQQQKATACIPHYWPPYKSSKQTTPRFKSFISYLIAYKNEACCSHSPKLFRSHIFSGLTKLANLCLPPEIKGYRSFTSHSFERWLKNNYEKDLLNILNNVSSWFYSIATGSQVEEIHSIIVKFFITKSIVTPYLDKPALEFLKSTTVDPSSEQDPTCNSMCCSEALEIQVGTVHSVKGETHTGTMLMESKYYLKHDSEYLMPMLKGKTPKLKNRESECTKIAHVAISRPTHLFVMACHEDRINAHKKDLKENGWQILSVKKILSG